MGLHCPFYSDAGNYPGYCTDTPGGVCFQFHTPSGGARVKRAVGPGTPQMGPITQTYLHFKNLIQLYYKNKPLYYHFINGNFMLKEAL